MENIGAAIKEFRETWIEFKKNKTMKFIFQLLFIILVAGIIVNFCVFTIKSINNKPSEFVWIPNGIEPDTIIKTKDSIIYIRVVDTVFSAGRDVNHADRDQTINNGKK